MMIYLKLKENAMKRKFTSINSFECVHFKMFRFKEQCTHFALTSSSCSLLSTYRLVLWPELS